MTEIGGYLIFFTMDADFFDETLFDFRVRSMTHSRMKNLFTLVGLKSSFKTINFLFHSSIIITTLQKSLRSIGCLDYSSDLILPAMKYEQYYDDVGKFTNFLLISGLFSSYHHNHRSLVSHENVNRIGRIYEGNFNFFFISSS